MPLYEYCCPSCCREFELLRPFSQSDEAAVCPKCNHEAEKMVSSFASFAKGSDGFSTPVGGGRSCGTCSASSCATCN